MKRALLPILLLLGLAGSSAVHAIAIEVRPAVQTVSLGTPVTVDVVVSDPAGAVIGAFDLFLEFDPAILSMPVVTFGTGLGDQMLTSIASVDDTMAGILVVAEASLLFPPPAATDGQVLFSVLFATIGAGTTLVVPQPNLDVGLPDPVFLGDDAIPGNPIPVDAAIAAEITVTAPEPGSLALLALGGGIVLAARRRRAPR